MDHEGLILTEISQMKKDKTPYDFTHMWNLKKKKRTNKTKQRQTHRYREQTGGYQSGREVGGRGGERVKGVNYMVIDGN